MSGYIIQRLDGTIDGMGDRIVFSTYDRAEQAITVFLSDPSSAGPNGVFAWLEIVSVDEQPDDGF